MAIPLRGDFDAFLLRAIARKSKDAPQARRLLAPAAIHDCAFRRSRPLVSNALRPPIPIDRDQCGADA